MLFQAFLFPDVNEVNTFMIGCEQTRNAVLIDAGADSPAYDEFLQKHEAQLTGIFLTHFHWDHDQEIPALVNKYDVPVFSMTGNTPNGKAVGEGDSIPIGLLGNRIVQTTGHTPDGISLIVEDRIAFVGDAIFAGSIGGTSSDENKLEEMTHIQNKIFTLPDACMLCSGHGPITTVGIEKNHNPIFIVR
jgi:glyoxylase-like metal-dependent hydrolase (beta-lactamase superfamily II)